MSKWDDLDRGSERLVTRAGSGAIAGNTVFLPSDTEKLSILLCGEAPKTSTLADIHDLARLAEDFVLCDYIGVPSTMFHYVGPHLVHLCSWESFPLLDLVGITSELNEKVFEYKKVAADLRNSVRQRESESISASNQLEHSRGLDDFLKATEQYVQMLEVALSLKRIGERSDPRDEQSRTLAAGIDGENDSSVWTLSSFFREAGLSASPGWRYRAEFAARPKTPGRFFYDAVADNFAVDLAAVQAWYGEQQPVVPPVMTLLVARAGSPKFLLQELIGLRQEFEEVRRVADRYGSSLADASTIKEKVEVIREMENARDALIRRISKVVQKTVVHRLWDLVKGFTLSSALTHFTDVILEWDHERHAVSSVRSFVDMYRLATDVRSKPEQFAHIFGEITD
jgi:hypothetical protein